MNCRAMTKSPLRGKVGFWFTTWLLFGTLGSDGSRACLLHGLPHVVLERA